MPDASWQHLFWAGFWGIDRRRRLYACRTETVGSAVPNGDTVLIPASVPVEADVSDTQYYDYYDDMQLLKAAIGLTVYVEDGVVSRPEYDRLVRRMDDGDLKSMEKVVVTGQPGIGKTMFLIFVLLDRMRQRLPTAIQVQNDMYHIFDEEGCATVFIHNCQASRAMFGRHERLQKCWALVDSNDEVN